MENCHKYRPWLNCEAKNVKTCSMCIKLANINSTYMTNNPNPKPSNPLLKGCSNFKTSALNDHEASFVTNVYNNWTKVRMCLAPSCYAQMMVDYCLHLGKQIGTVYSLLLKFFNFFPGQTEIILVLWSMFSNRTECPMEFKKISRTLYIEIKWPIIHHTHPWCIFYQIWHRWSLLPPVFYRFLP